MGVVLNPALWLNSSIWGQIDSIFMIFVLLFLRGLRQKKFAFAACMLAIAVLIKPQGLLLGPFLLLALAKQRDFKAWLQAFGTGAVTFLLPVVPFMIHKGFSWIFTLYFGTLGSYPYASLNAFNLFALFGETLQTRRNRSSFCRIRLGVQLGCSGLCWQLPGCT
ncbi:glycosyltransferase 87 family protein [Paenibacillus larvae]|nr:glycosyltransferase 87 family protein [Paenibacillus larvae]MDT2235158.1 glycosyltransferase 87 family protein [Paenibacillus larvae]MDT2259844.1 glycosyltransferase 87 family protein [Paenibacillus larvae]